MPKFNNGESAASVRQKINDAIDKVDGVQAISDADITGGTIDGTVIGGVTPAAGTFTNLTANTDLTINSTTTVTAILDEDDLVSDSATALATQQSIKAYVDAQVTAQDLDFAGDSGTGAIDLDSQVFTVAGTANQITTVASGQNITISLPATISTTTADLTNIEVTNIKAKDGTAAATIADATGVVTIPSAVLTTADINGGTIDGTTIGGTTPAAGTFSTATVNGNITVTGTVDGRDIAADGTKLDTVETNADVTDTANVTAAGAVMDSELTNEAAVKALDQGVATTDSPTFAATTINGNITVTGTVDGRNVAEDGTKLDGIEAGADVTDPTNVQAAGALMDSELTSEASVKALNQGVATTDSPSFAGLTVDTNTLYVDGTNNRVGVGAASPEANQRLTVRHTDVNNMVSMGNSLEGLASGTNNGGAIYFGINASAADQPTGGIEASWGDASDPQIHFGLTRGGRNTRMSASFADGLQFYTNTGTTTLERLRITNIGDVQFYEDTGTTPQMVWDASADALTFKDNVKATFGAGSDLQIYHDGFNSYIQDSGTGDLKIYANDFNVWTSTGSARYLDATSGGAVNLYHNGNAKLATTATGVDVTGTVTADTLSINQASDFGIGTISSDTNWGMYFRSDNVGGIDPAIADFNFASNANENRLRIASNGDISFYEDTGTTPKFFWDASAERLGIGTSSPTQLFEVSGSESTSPTVATSLINTESGAQLTTAATGTTFATAGWIGVQDGVILRTGAGTSGGLALTTGGTAPIIFGIANVEKARISSSGSLGIGTSSPSEKLDVSGNVTISGSLSKGSGSFKIDHPVKPDTHHLVHSFLEGPQADNLYRGKVALVDGEATVNLDAASRMTEGTFVALNGNIQCFTTNEDGWTQVRGRVDGNILTIEAQDASCNDTVSWLVIGERHDQHMIDANWTDEQGRVITEPAKKAN